jgi:PAS domain S-box-containing protein
MDDAKKTKDQLIAELNRLRKEIETSVEATQHYSANEETIILSERFTRSIIDSSIDMIIATDNDRKIVQFNAAAQNTFGYLPNEILGTHVGILYATKDEADKVSVIMRSSGFFSGEIVNKRKSGEVFPSYLSASVLRGQDNAILGVVGISRDISKQKQAEKEVAEKEQLYRTLFEGAHDAIFTMDLDRFIDCNHMTLSMFGCSSKEEIIDRHPWEFSPEQQPDGRSSRDSAAEKITAALQGKPQRFYWKHIKMDGSPFDAEVSLSRIQLNDGILLQAIVRNITEQWQAREALNISEKKYRNIVNHAPVGFYQSNPEGQFITVNDTLAAILGYESAGELWKMNIGSDVYYNKGDRERLIKQYENKAIGKDIEVQWKRKDRSPIWVQINIHTVYNPHGTIQYYDGFVRDITERKRAEDALRASEERYRSLFDQMLDGVYRSTHDGKFVDINAAMAAMFGYDSIEEMLKVDIKKDLYFKPDDRSNHALEVGKERIEEYLMRRKDGTPIWVEDHGRYVHDENGTIIYHEGMLRNITERKRSEEALRQSEYWLRESQRVARIGSYDFDITGDMWKSSSVLDEIFGIGPDDVRTMKTWSDLVHPDDRQEMILYFVNHVIGQKKRFNKEYRIVRKNDGETRWVWGLGELSIGNDGKPYRMIGTIQDITDRFNLQHQLMQLEKVQSIGTLAGGIAHDFNNILAIILAYSSRLKRGKMDQEQLAESLTSINNAVERGAALVRQILTFARKTEVTFAPMDLTDLIHEISSMLRETFPKTIIIQEIFKAEIPKVNADKTQIHQALLNLCVNARDAMPNGGTITITANTLSRSAILRRFPNADHAAYVQIAVSDTGMGMDRETKEKIFDPFFTTKEKGKGTGLGLSVVFGVLQTHSGFIDVESVLSAGTTFRVYLPALIEHEAPTITVAKEAEEIPGGNETILLVEDEEMLRTIIQSNLVAYGYTVMIAGDGKEAVELYRKHRNEIALVLTDIGLPVMSGIEEFHHLKMINPAVKVIIASGYFEPDVRMELYAAGAIGFIQKPYVMNDLLMKIREVLDE